MTRYALAVDVGGTKLEAALVGDDGMLVAGSRSRQATGRNATPTSMDAAVEAVITHALVHVPAGADLDVERLDQHAALLGPVRVQTLDQLLEGRGGGRAGFAGVRHVGGPWCKAG